LQTIPFTTKQCGSVENIANHSDRSLERERQKMVVLDTDLISLLVKSGDVSQRLQAKLDTLERNQIATTIITYEEQTRGWFAYLAKAKTMAGQVDAYTRLLQHLKNYRKIEVLPFDDVAATVFQSLQKLRLKVGTFDLKIAAVTIAHEATLLSRNLGDFGKVPGLLVEDWTRD
jgi:tRNA(fMet)-specific endonuclease VapC